MKIELQWGKLIIAMKFYHRSKFIIGNTFITVIELGLLINLINFAFLSLAVFGHFDTFPGGGVDGWGKNQA